MRIRAASLAAKVYDDLRRRITEQKLESGSRLAVIPLAGRFGISPTPVREALARLHADGLVTLAPNRGYRVAPGPDSVSRMQWMDARIILEVNTLRLAAPGVAGAVLDTLQALNDRLARGRFSGDFEHVRAFAQLNADFHSTLVAAAGNPYLLGAWRQVALTAQFSRVHFHQGVRHQAAITAEHQAVIDALRRGDTDGAAEALRRHIVISLDRDDAAAPEPGRRRAGRKTMGATP
jgi:DNA-binding GntR family transcriptional regulator